MNKNFSVKDAVFFELKNETLDARELVSVTFHPGTFPSVEMLWVISASNQRLQILFSNTRSFIIKCRDEEYPLQSGATLSIAGFSRGYVDTAEPELYLEPTYDMSYMTFVMPDKSAFFISADTVLMRWV